MNGARSAANASSALPLQWPLVGRHEQLDLFLTTLADPRAHGLVIHGPAGVGKTRLADQCLALAAADGRNVARATATEGSSTVPLGALAHLLPTGLADERDLVAVMAEVRAVLREQNGALVLLVDDLALLDVASATLLGQLVDAGLVFLVGTVRTAASVPPGLDALWQRARVRRVDLADLDRAAIDTLLHLVLGGPVEATTSAAICTASQGNVLFVRELVLGAVETGRLVHQRGVWRLVGPLVTTTRLQELVAARLGALASAATDALDILAVWEPAGLSTLESIVGFEQLELLDRSGLLVIRTDERRQQVTLAHPLYGEILRARMPALKRRRLLLEHADRIAAYGARRREDPIRVATARLEATGAADPRLLVRAALLARYGHDFTQVERLARAALVGGPSAEAGLLLGEALHEMGEFAEADQVLTSAEAVAEPGDGLVHIIEMRSRNLMWGLLRYDEAGEVNEAALQRIGAGPGAAELTLNGAMLLTYSGLPAEALAVLDRVETPPQSRARALHAISAIPSLIVVGRCGTAVEAASAAFAAQSQLPDQIAIPGPGVHIINQIWALAECGRLAEASGLAEAAYEATPATAPPDALMWFSQQLGRTALLAGRVETATRWLEEAVARGDAHNMSGARRLVLSLLATAHAYHGDADAAAGAVAELERIPPFAFARAEQDMGRAWAQVAAGDLPGARQVLRTAAAHAATHGYRTTEAWLLHDVARLGEPATVAARLGALAAECESDLINAYAVHAAAAAAGRADDLVDAADRFEAMGACLLAAEAATEAAQAYQRGGERRAATAASMRATALADACEGARTPGLTVPVTVVALTPRERDIAAFAAQGQSSKEIADRLYLSVRTVNNHLQSVYSKLGVAGRHELPDALSSSASPPTR